MLTHDSWNAASQGWAQAMALGPDDRVLLPFPLAFTGGLAVWLFTYWSGGCVVLERAFDPTRALELIEAERITGLFAVPAIYQSMIAHPRWDDTDLSSWRVASSGGAAVPESIIRTVQARGVPMAQGFSLTEASAAVTVLAPRDALRKLGSAGLAVMHTRVMVADDDDRPVPAGELGEILVGGPQIMTGYWNQPEASRQALRNGWLHTGDIGRLDDEGYLYVVDRMKDMLISGGLNVYPAEIERLLAALPGITEVAVIGVPDERWGETPAVIAVGDPAQVTPDSVLDACSETLADFKLPRYLVVRDEPLPRNMSAKVQKRVLLDQYRDLAATTPAHPLNSPCEQQCSTSTGHRRWCRWSTTRHGRSPRIQFRYRAPGPGRPQAELARVDVVDQARGTSADTCGAPRRRSRRRRRPRRSSSLVSMRTSGCSGGSYGESIPVKFASSPRRAFA